MLELNQTNHKGGHFAKYLASTYDTRLTKNIGSPRECLHVQGAPRDITAIYNMLSTMEMTPEQKDIRSKANKHEVESSGFFGKSVFFK